MPRKAYNEKSMSVYELAKRLGKDPKRLYDTMRRGDFPLGIAYRGSTGGWVYCIPREPAEHFIRTGRVPE